MTKLEKIEQDIKALSSDEFRALAAWFDRQRASTWDADIEADLQSGRLDKLISETRDDIAAGKTKPL